MRWMLEVPLYHRACVFVSRSGATTTVTVGRETVNRDRLGNVAGVVSHGGTTTVELE